jgi:hypothetical protein
MGCDVDHSSLSQSTSLRKRATWRWSGCWPSLVPTSDRRHLMMATTPFGLQAKMARGRAYHKMLAMFLSFVGVLHATRSLHPNACSAYSPVSAPAVLLTHVKLHGAVANTLRAAWGSHLRLSPSPSPCATLASRELTIASRELAFHSSFASAPTGHTEVVRLLIS